MPVWQKCFVPKVSTRIIEWFCTSAKNVTLSSRIPFRRVKQGEILWPMIIIQWTVVSLPLLTYADSALCKFIWALHSEIITFSVPMTFFLSLLPFSLILLCEKCVKIYYFSNFTSTNFLSLYMYLFIYFYHSSEYLFVFLSFFLSFFLSLTKTKCDCKQHSWRKSKMNKKH